MLCRAPSNPQTNGRAPAQLLSFQVPSLYRWVQSSPTGASCPRAGWVSMLLLESLRNMLTQ